MCSGLHVAFMLKFYRIWRDFNSTARAQQQGKFSLSGKSSHKMPFAAKLPSERVWTLHTKQKIIPLSVILPTIFMSCLARSLISNLLLLSDLLKSFHLPSPFHFWNQPTPGLNFHFSVSYQGIRINIVSFFCFFRKFENENYFLYYPYWWESSLTLTKTIVTKQLLLLNILNFKFHKLHIDKPQKQQSSFFDHVSTI